jgi:pimeloyl-ACP methyl ester carboxylesterase
MTSRRSRIVFVHGSVMGGQPTWSGQRSLAGLFELEIVERPGFPPNPPIDDVDFDEDAVLVAEALGEGAHLVGHSYGGVIALLAAAAAPRRTRSLTVIEPPAMRVARGTPAADAFAREGIAWWRDGPTDDPETFLRGFLRFVGSDYDPPSPLPPALEQGARMLIVERGPWEAEIPLDELAATGIPVLVVSGGHNAGFDAVCDVLVERLGAERLVLPGYGHTAQRHPGFNERLGEFVRRAEARTRG